MSTANTAPKLALFMYLTSYATPTNHRVFQVSVNLSEYVFVFVICSWAKMQFGALAGLICVVHRGHYNQVSIKRAQADGTLNIPTETAVVARAYE